MYLPNFKNKFKNILLQIKDVIWISLTLSFYLKLPKEGSQNQCSSDKLALVNVVATEAQSVAETKRSRDLYKAARKLINNSNKHPADRPIFLAFLEIMS